MFADKLTDSIKRSKSVVCAGFDPVIETFPAFIKEAARKSSGKTEEVLYFALTSFFKAALGPIASKVAAIKPNLGFFESYGLAGMRAFSYLRDLAKNNNLPVIADAKRGDIGSTASAYARAFLGKNELFGSSITDFESDALTVNPFLGFETITPFIEACREKGKGIFVLVKTSNPGSADLQGITEKVSGDNASTKIAKWIQQQGELLKGKSGWSGLGAVVGATYPTDMAELRNQMPSAYFLIPGFGAQGGSAKDIVAGFSNGHAKTRGGAIVNISRGLFSDIPAEINSQEPLEKLLNSRLAEFNSQLANALGQ